MKKFNLNITAFLYTFFAYAVYLVVFVFVKRSGYQSGIYLFVPAYLFAFYKVFQIGLWKKTGFLLYMVFPFIASVYLSASDSPAGWEVTGIIPFTVIATFLFKSGSQPDTPLANIYITKICGFVLAAVIFFSTVHFFRTGDINSALYLAVSIYSPAPIFISLALFINFIISTAAISVVLNNLKLFNNGGRIGRLVFDGDDYLTLPHLNLSGIETAAGVSTDEFLNLVEQLNEVAGKSKEYAKQIKNKKLFSKKIGDSILAMAPIGIMLESGVYKTENIVLPQDGDIRSFIALARDSKVIGYYAIDKITSETNSDILNAITQTFKVQSVVVGATDPELWKKCCATVKNMGEVSVKKDDLVVSSTLTDSASYLACWGDKNAGRGDVFIVKPFLNTLLSLIIITSSLRDKFFKGIIIVSLPFAFSLFSVSMGLKIPQVSAASAMFSFVFTIFYVFYIKKKKADKRS
jgi:hypothetical protein